MKSNSFRFYGVPPIGKDIFIKQIINYVCFILGNGGNNNADLLIGETIKSETQNATAEDYSSDYGEGLGQFDKVAFDDVISRVKSKKEKVLKYFLIDLDKVKYEDLRNSPVLSVVLIRLKYLLVPSEIPLDVKERYEYYKKWYNSIKGKATLAHFLSSNGYGYNV